MALPKPISVQTINGLKNDALVYESHKRQIEAYNSLIKSLGPGTAIQPQNISFSGLGIGAVATNVSGTFLRGSFSVTVGTAPSANPSIALSFPQGTFAETPFGIVTRNGGTGTLGFTYFSTLQQLKLILSGTPVAAETYTFNYMVRE